MTASAPAPRGAFPSHTLTIALLALVALYVPGAPEFLAFDRGEVWRAQLWRLWTGPLVHSSEVDLGVNLFLFLLLGFRAERRTPRPVRKYLLIAPLAISLTLLLLQPRVTLYTGLAGLTTGLAAFLALRAWARRARIRAILLFFLLGLKLALECIRTAPVLGHLTAHQVLGHPLVHAVVIVTAGVLYFRRLGPPPLPQAATARA